MLHVPYSRILIDLVIQGSKRSRPPPNIGRAPLSKVNGISHSEPPRRSARLKSPSPPRVNANHITINGQGNEETDIPSPKRQRVLTPTVEEVADVDMHSPTSPTNMHPGDLFDSQESQPNAKKTPPTPNGNSANGTPKTPFPLKSSAPKEPSKLRFGFAAESDPDSPPPAKPAFDHPVPAPVQPHEPPSAIKRQPPAIPSRPDPAPSLEVESPPIPSSSTEANSVPKDAKEAALSLDSASLPLFSFDVPMTDSSQPTSKHDKERSTASAAEPPSLPVFSFVFEVKSAFNWEAAGMKLPAKATGSWTCGTCMVGNDAAKVKCVACEEPRPDSSSMTNGAAVSKPAAAPSTTSGGFDWAASGMKMPTKAPGTWACQTCMVDNDAAQVKCVSCEEPKPDLATGSSAVVPEPPSMPVVPPSGGFNWAAAGMKVPMKAQGTWTCNVCMVDNDPTKTKCISCEEPRA